MSTQNQKYLDYQGLSTVAPYVKERLKTVTTMPGSADNGTTVLFTGTTSGSYEQGHIYQYSTSTSAWVDITAAGGGGGADIYPVPSSSVTEAAVVQAVSAAQPANDKVASLYGTRKWSNKKSRLFEYNGTVGRTGIGAWQTKEYLDENPPSAADEAGWGWWYDDYFKSAEINALDTNGIEFKFSYDADEEIYLGGYHLDTDNGYLCIKFANGLKRPANAKIFIEFEIIRDDIS